MKHQLICSVIFLVPATLLPGDKHVDLGVLMVLQSVVEKLHHNKRMELNLLCRTVNDAWRS